MKIRSRESTLALVAAIVSVLLIGCLYHNEAKRVNPWSQKRKVNIALLAIWIIWLAVTIAIPSESYGRAIFSNTAKDWTQNFDIPPIGGTQEVKFTADLTFSTNGLFSPYNLIDMTVQIYNSDTPNLTSIFCCVGFTNAHYPINSQSVEVPPTLYQVGEGDYYASGRIFFVNQTNSYLLLFPHSQTGIGCSPCQLTASVIGQLHAHNSPVLYVGTQSDTLAIQFNQFTVKLAFVLGSFSILLLQPLIESIVLREERQTTKAT
jgi:hypothetical protein